MPRAFLVLGLAAGLSSGHIAAQTSDAQTDADQTDAAPTAPAPTPPAPTAPAQTLKTVSILVLNARNGSPIVPSNLLVRFDHKDDIQNQSLHIDENGTGQLTVPAGTLLISIQVAYDWSTQIYVNCDFASEKNSSSRQWYALSDILNAGVVTHNKCYKSKFENKLHIEGKPGEVTAKPGEIILFVRRRSELDPAPD